MDRERWLQALSIDLETGLDPPNFKVRAAQGLDAAVRSSFSALSRISRCSRADTTTVRIYSGYAAGTLVSMRITSIS